MVLDFEKQRIQPKRDEYNEALSKDEVILLMKIILQQEEILNCILFALI